MDPMSGGEKKAGWLFEEMNIKVGSACSTLLVYCNQLILLKNTTWYSSCQRVNKVAI